MSLVVQQDEAHVAVADAPDSFGAPWDADPEIAVVAGRAHRMAKAIELLRKDYDKPLRIAALARQLAMSESGFHHHFKAVTALSPLQLQKHLRLQEARRLLLGADFDAATAGSRVTVLRLRALFEDAAHEPSALIERSTGPVARWTAGLAGAWPARDRDDRRAHR